MKVAVFNNDAGGVSVLIPAPGRSLHEVVQKDMPKGIKFSVSAMDKLPDRTFRDSWELSGKDVTINVTKAKDMAHRLRRQKREQEFKPYDEVLMKQIPGTDIDAIEYKRDSIRRKYWRIQDDIDACESPDELKEVIQKEDLDGVHI